MLRRVAIAAFLAAVALVSGRFVAVAAQLSNSNELVPHLCGDKLAPVEEPRFAETQARGSPKSGQSATEELTENAPDDSQDSKFSATGRELFFKTMLAVLLVIALGAAAIYTSRKLLPRITNLPGKQIRILETAHLGPKKAVHLIEIGNQKLLIGSTNENITMLADLTGQRDFKFET